MPFTDSIKELTISFILGLWEIKRRGLKILSSLIIFKNPRS